MWLFRIRSAFLKVHMSVLRRRSREFLLIYRPKPHANHVLLKDLPTHNVSADFAVINNGHLNYQEASLISY